MKPSCTLKAGCIEFGAGIYKCCGARAGETGCQTLHACCEVVSPSFSWVSKMNSLNEISNRLQNILHFPYKFVFRKYNMLKEMATKLAV